MTFDVLISEIVMVSSKNTIFKKPAIAMIVIQSQKHLS